MGISLALTVFSCSTNDDVSLNSSTGKLESFTEKLPGVFQSSSKENLKYLIEKGKKILFLLKLLLIL